MTKPKAARTTTPAPVADKSRTIELGRKEGETEDQAIAGMMIRGTVANASTLIDYSRTQHAGLSLTAIARAMKTQGDAVSSGDLASLEHMLNGQAVALNAMFVELARRGALNMGEHLDAMDRYIRLALKAQSQARATVETLAAIKNPPMVFARQANINNGGQQQVNNGLPTDKAGPESARASARPRPGETESVPNELSRGSHELLADTRASTAAGRENQGLGALEAVHRAANGRG